MSETAEKAGLKSALAFTPENMKRYEEVLTHYPTRQAALIPALHIAQEQWGWVSDEVIDYVADLMELPAAHIKGVVSFYTMLYKKPVGKHMIWSCCTLPCALRGALNTTGYLEKKLGIRSGETTEDGRFTLMKMECLAACDRAPVLQVDGEYYYEMTPDKINDLLDKLRKD